MRKLRKPTISIAAPCRLPETLRWLRTPIALSLALAGTWLAGMAQEQPLNTSSRTVARRVERRDAPLVASIRMDVNRVLIPVMVTDAYDRKVEGLHKQDFRIFQDGVEQTVSEFFVDDSPVSAGIVLDSSNSMLNKVDSSRQALRAFLRLSIPGDEFFLVTVQNQPELVHAFTTNVDEIDREIAGIRTQGWTALYDGMYVGINHAKHGIHDNRVLLVISDGGDNNSRYTETEVRSLIRESGIRVYSVSLLGRSPSLEKLAQESGGRSFRIHKLDELPDLAVSLSAAIHGQYVVGFSPATMTRDGKYHTTKVEVVQPTDGTHLSASWRHGYYAPLQ